MSYQDPRAESQRLLNELPPAVIQAIRQAPRPRGRPRGSGIDDTARLRQMALLLVQGEAKSERQAARLVSCEDPGYSEDATANRLRRKFACQRRELTEWAKSSLQRANTSLTRDRGAPRDPRRVLSDPLSLDPTLGEVERLLVAEPELMTRLTTPGVLEELRRITEAQHQVLGNLGGANLDQRLLKKVEDQVDRGRSIRCATIALLPDVPADP